MWEINVVDVSVRDAVNRFIAASLDMAPAMRPISELLVSTTHGNFLAQGGPLGPWPALKDKRRAGGKILIDTRALERSITGHHGADFAGAGSDVPYAGIHQLGGDINKAAQSRLVRHRTNAKGELLRSKALRGKGLIFAKDGDKNAVGRWFEQAEHTIHIPARPYLPVGPDGALQAGVDAGIVEIMNAYYTAAFGG